MADFIGRCFSFVKQDGSRIEGYLQSVDQNTRRLTVAQGAA